MIRNNWAHVLVPFIDRENLRRIRVLRVRSFGFRIPIGHPSGCRKEAVKGACLGFGEWSGLWL